MNEAVSSAENFEVFRLCLCVALVEGSDVKSGNIL
jgi:hypothetical protein